MSLPGTVTSATRYVVHTHFKMGSRIPGMANIENRLQRLNRTINAVGRSFALIYAGVGMRRLAGAFVSIHTEIEDARTGLAGLISAITGMEMPKALQAAAESVETLRIAAAKLPGDLPQYLRAMQMVYGPARGAGASRTQIEELAKLSVVAGFSTGKGALGMKTMPLDVQQALTKGIGDNTTQDLNTLLRLVNPKYGESSYFNALPRPERLDLITEALERMQGAAEILGMTFNAQALSLRDNLRELGRQMSGGLYNEITRELVGINEAFERNADSVSAWAYAIDKQLLIAYLKLKLLVLNPKVQAGLAQGAGVVAGGYAGRLGGAVAMAIGVARGVPGVGMVVGALTWLGAAMGRVMVAFPDDTQRLVESLAKLGGAVGKLMFELGRFLLDNPLMTFAMRELLQAMADVANSTAILAAGLGELLRVINDLIATLPELPDVPSPSEYLNKSVEAVASGHWMATLASPTGRSIINRRFGGVNTMQPSVDASGLARLNNFNDLRRAAEASFGFDPLPPQSELTDEDIQGPGDVNLNGPIRIVIRAEKVDNPDLVARSFQEVADRFSEYRRGGRANLVAKLG